MFLLLFFFVFHVFTAFSGWFGVPCSVNVKFPSDNIARVISLKKGVQKQWISLWLEFVCTVQGWMKTWKFLHIFLVSITLKKNLPVDLDYGEKININLAYS